MKVIFLSLFLLCLKSLAGTLLPPIPPQPIRGPDAVTIPAPKKNVVRGCPCLDCPYFLKGHRSGMWTAKKEVPLYAVPGGDTPTTTILMPGESAIAVGGELHVTPGELRILHRHGKFNLRDTVYLIQEDADAKMWKLWYKGKTYYDDLSAMVSYKEKCKNPSASCWARVISPLKTEWWINLRTKDKQNGWINTAEDFDFDRSSCM